jgi:hypothetical protein
VSNAGCLVSGMNWINVLPSLRMVALSGRLYATSATDLHMDPKGYRTIAEVVASSRVKTAMYCNEAPAYLRVAGASAGGARGGKT